MTQVAGWVQDMTADVFGKNSLKIGNTVKHRDGRAVKITAGQYWGEYGLSNFWHWSEVLEDGQLGPDEHGYGYELNG